MSWALHVDRRSSRPSAISKYEVTASRDGGATALGPFRFELERKAILFDFARLLPLIMTSSIRFRSELRFEELQSDPLDTLTTLGKRVYLALPTDVREAIDNAKSIHLFTDDLEIPWEIMHNDEGFIGLKHSFGISLLVKRRLAEIEPKIGGRLRVLFIVDTKNNLPQTQAETKKIVSMLATNPRVDYMVLKGEEATYSSVKSVLLREHFDIVHFATHAKFEEDAPEESGVVLNDAPLRAREFYSILEGEPPWLVFMNACESAKSKDLSYFQKYGELSGLAFAFIAAGASSYVGTTCLVNDASASEIGVSFYSNLLDRLSVGESLRKAKVDFFKNHPDDLSWSAFTLYGDPDSRISFEKTRDLHSEVRAYIIRKKGSFSISECAKDLGLPISDIKKVLAELKRN